jgi:arginase
METVFAGSSVGATCLGAHLGPDAIRSALHEQGLDNLLDPIIRTEITDIPTNNNLDELKDCQMNHPETVYNNLKEVIDTVGQTREDFTLVFSGDHSTGAGTYFGLRKKFVGQRIGVIWFDAHADLNCPGSSDSGNLHGMPVGIMLHRGFDGNELYKEYDGFSDEDKRHWWSEMKFLGSPLGHTDLVYIGARDIDEGETPVIEK